MDTLRKISSQTLWQILAKIVTASATLIILSLVTRKYGEVGTGVYTLALAYLSFFYFAADFGVNAHVLPELAKPTAQTQWRKLLGFRIALGFGLAILSVLLLPLLPFQSSDFNLAVILGSLSVAAYAVFVSAGAFFQSRFLYKYNSMSIILSTLVSFFLILFFLSRHDSLPVLIIGSVAGWIVAAALSYVWTKRKIATASPIFNLSYALGLIKETWPISLTLLANTLYFRVDAFLLSSLQNLHEVGLYNLPYSAFQAALVFPTFVMNGYYPVMIRDFASNRPRFFKELKIAVLALLALGVLGTVFTIFSSRMVIDILGGKGKFMGSKDALTILSLGFPAFFLSSLCMWVFVLLKKYKTLLLIYALALGVNIGLNLLVIPQYSFLGAAWVTTLCEYLILISQVAILYKIWT